MRKSERLSAILDQVGLEGSVDVAALAVALGVSGATIRRDLQTLSRNQLLVRTHGGALSNQAGDEKPTRVKAILRQAEKRTIGRAAAAFVEEGAVVGMTGGTTALELSRALAQRRGITVVTNAINIAAELVGHAGVRLVLIGGLARSSYELVGPAAEAMLANYHLDVAFIGVDGLTPEEGCTTYDEMEAQTDLAFLRRARRSVVIADSSKIGRVTFARISRLSDITDIVTDRNAHPDQLESLERAGVRVTIV
ncbi:DeoR/GlpR family DNA-binding transcription regulator [Kribbella jiaozuonensis]|uniref:DeoR/GlpR family DNA-binding transcription regulator n=1 Tax=Kribbella jiaozuonensis TaxID=2575441 RepID=UPI00192D76A3|nr:DeoR/GlpR family DNA-binding transcription regulator [Kribbella jiaozuonensis]